MGALGIIGLILIVVFCIAALGFLALAAMDLVDISNTGLVVLTGFLALILIAGAIWAFVAILDFP